MEFMKCSNIVPVFHGKNSDKWKKSIILLSEYNQFLEPTNCKKWVLRWGPWRCKTFLMKLEDRTVNYFQIRSSNLLTKIYETISACIFQILCGQISLVYLKIMVWPFVCYDHYVNSLENSIWEIVFYFITITTG